MCNFCGLKNEQWRRIAEDIPNRYEVSSIGRIRSLDYHYIDKNGKKNFSKGKIIIGSLAGDGYIAAQLSLKKHFYAHRLVVKYFLGGFTEIEKTVNHKDGNKKHNCINNLERMSMGGNISHRTRVLGQRVHNQKFDKNVADEIRKKYLSGGISQKKLGLKYGASTMVINRIINNVQFSYAKI